MEKIEQAISILGILALMIWIMHVGIEIIKINDRLDYLTLEIDYLEKNLDQRSQPRPEEFTK